MKIKNKPICEYCNTDLSYGTKELHSFDGMDIFIGNETLIINDNPSNSTTRIEIQYCPMCGRKFEDIL